MIATHSNRVAPMRFHCNGDGSEEIARNAHGAVSQFLNSVFTVSQLPVIRVGGPYTSRRRVGHLKQSVMGVGMILLGSTGMGRFLEGLIARNISPAIFSGYGLFRKNNH